MRNPNGQGKADNRQAPAQLEHIEAIEKRLRILLERNPLRTDFQRHYEAIVADYNREKDRLTIEKTFEDPLRFMQELGKEEERHIREGLYEEALAVFDLLKKTDLDADEIKRVKKVAAELLDTLKAQKLKIDPSAAFLPSPPLAKGAGGGVKSISIDAGSCPA